MKTKIVLFLAALCLSACADAQPSRSKCFSGPTVSCKFVPLDELNAKARRS